MTFSIVARDPRTGAFGAAVATGTPVVGGLVLHLAADVGAIATQGLSTNPFYGIRGLRLLEAGLTAEDVCRKLIGEDDGRDVAPTHHRRPKRPNRRLDRRGQRRGETCDSRRARCRAGRQLGGLSGRHRRGEGCLREQRRADIRGKVDRCAGGRRTGGRRSSAACVQRQFGSYAAIIRLSILRADFDPQPIMRLAEIHRATLEPDFQAFLARVPTIADPMRR